MKVILQNLDSFLKTILFTQSVMFIKYIPAGEKKFCKYLFCSLNGLFARGGFPFLHLNWSFFFYRLFLSIKG